MNFTLTGQVPASAQKTQYTGGYTFAGSLFPVDTTLDNLNVLNNMPGWTTNADFTLADLLQVWDATTQTWQTYYHTGTQWQVPLDPRNRTHGGDTIAAGSAVFIVKRNSPAANSSMWNYPLPYSLN